jgi:hypothetical protein
MQSLYETALTAANMDGNSVDDNSSDRFMKKSKKQTNLRYASLDNAPLHYSN